MDYSKTLPCSDNNTLVGKYSRNAEKPRRAIGMAFAVVVAAFPLFIAETATAQSIPVVELVELSGPGATNGTHMRDGVMLAAKEINASGGILGRTLSISVADTQTQPAVAKA